jgi:hypothetical protein
MTERLTPVEQAEQEIPPRWYEKQQVVIGSGALAGLSSIVAWEQLPDHPVLAYVVGGLLTVGSVIADKRKAIEVFDAIDEATEAGLGAAYYDAAPGPNVSAKEFIRDRRRKRMDNFLMIAGLIPPIAAGITSSKLLNTMRNSRKARRIRRAVELVPKGPTQPPTSV